MGKTVAFRSERLIYTLQPAHVTCFELLHVKAIPTYCLYFVAYPTIFPSMVFMYVTTVARIFYAQKACSP